MEPRSPSLQVDSLPTEPLGKPSSYPNKIGVLLDDNSYKAEATLLDKICSLVCYFSLINEETRFQDFKQFSASVLFSSVQFSHSVVYDSL